MESWFIPLNIIMIILILFAIVLSLIFFLIIIFDKTCRTIPMLFVGNTCLAHFLFGFDLLGKCIFTLYNDLKQIEYVYPLCRFSGYFGYAIVCIFNYSFVVQALYRYVSVIYPARLFWKSLRNQIIFISCIWIFGFTHSLLALLNNTILYNADNQICQVTVGWNFTMVYLANTIYLIPNALMAIIYLKLVWHVRQISKRVAPVNLLFHAQRELAMVRRTVMIISILVALGFPYLIFLLMSFFTNIYKYHLRISFAFIDTSSVLVIIPLFQFTEPLKTSVMKRLRRQPNVIVPTVT